MILWKDIPGWEGLYQASSEGQIKALEKRRYSGRNHTTCRIYPERILKGSVSPRGYNICTLCKDGKVTSYTLHSLIAQTFIPNPENKPEVNHIDGNKLNNCVNNLEWVTYYDNRKHAFIELNKTSAITHILIDVISGEKYQSARQAYMHNNFQFTFRHFRKMLTGKRKNHTNFKIIENENSIF